MTYACIFSFPPNFCARPYSSRGNRFRDIAWKKTKIRCLWGWTDFYDISLIFFNYLSLAPHTNVTQTRNWNSAATDLVSSLLYVSNRVLDLSILAAWKECADQPCTVAFRRLARFEVAAFLFSRQREKGKARRLPMWGGWQPLFLVKAAEGVGQFVQQALPLLLWT